MQLIITERQFKNLALQFDENELIDEQDAADAAPEAGTSSDGEVKTGASKWESGATRGPANQIGVTKWSDVVGSTLKRGKSNPLSEQSDYMMDKRGNALLNTFGIRSDKDYKDMDKAIDSAKKSMGGEIDPHTLNMVLGIAAVFIPVVGPFISAGIGMYDAKLYYDEGDKKTAGMVAMFSLLPGIGSVVNKIPGVKQLGAKAMAQIGKKLALGTKLTNPVEIEVVNQIAKNRNLIELELKKASANIAKNKTAKQISIATAKSTAKKKLAKQAIAKKASTIAKTTAAYGAAGVTYSKAYDKIAGKPKTNITQSDVDRFSNSKEPPITYKEEEMELVNGIWVPKD